MKKIIVAFLSLVVLICVSGCSNTVNGAGQDMETMGRWIQGDR